MATTDTDYFDPGSGQNPDQGGGIIPGTEVPQVNTANPQLVVDAEQSVGWAVAIAALAIVAWLFLPVAFPVLAAVAAVVAVVAVAKTATAITDFVTGGLGTDTKRTPPVVQLVRSFMWLFWLLLALGIAVWYYRRKKRA